MKTYNFPDRLKNTTFRAIRFTLSSEGSPIDLTGATIKCQFRSSGKTGAVKKDISNGNGITIVDATAGIIEIDSFNLTNWSAGTYYYDVLITFSSGLKEIYFGGQQVIHQNVTQE